MSRKVNHSNILNKRFGRLIVVEFLYMEKVKQKDRLRNKYYYKCICDCGIEVDVASSCLGHGVTKTRSCGCLQKEGLIVGHAKQRGKARLSAQKPNGQSIIRSRFLSVKASAVKRNIDFILTENEYREIVSRNCSYCNEEAPIVTKKNHVIGVKINSLDRLNSNLSYTPDNCVSSCIKCNLSKHVMSMNEWICHMRKILNFLNTRNLEGQ